MMARFSSFLVVAASASQTSANWSREPDIQKEPKVTLPNHTIDAGLRLFCALRHPNSGTLIQMRLSLTNGALL